MSEQPKRRPGRPPKPPHLRNDPRSVTIRVLPDLRRLLDQACDERQASLSEEISLRLRDSFQREQWTREIRLAIRAELAGDPLSEASNADD